MKDDMNQRRKAEYDMDATRLAAIEAQLDEIRRKKMLKAQREEQRRLRKIQYEASVIIQDQVRVFLSKRKTEATTIFKDYLLCLQKTEIIRVFAWACRIIKLFLKRNVWKWQRYKAKIKKKYHCFPHQR